jgi:hypothetical protein
VEIPRICQDCLLCRTHALPYLVFHAPQPDDETQNLGLGLGSFFNNGPAAKSRANNDEQPIAVPLSAQEWEQLLLAYRTHVPEQPEPPAIIFLENGETGVGKRNQTSGTCICIQVNAKAFVTPAICSTTWTRRPSDSSTRRERTFLSNWLAKAAPFSQINK